MKNTYINEDYKAKTGVLKAPSISLDDLVNYVMAALRKAHKEAVAKGITDLEEPESPDELLDVYILQETYQPGRSQCSEFDQIKKDLDQVLSLDYLQGHGVIPNERMLLADRIPFLKYSIEGQDKECVVYIYWDGSSIRAYVPVCGNWINLKNKMIFGDNIDDDADEAIRQGLDSDYLDDEDNWNPNYEACKKEFAEALGLVIDVDLEDRKEPKTSFIPNTDIPYGRIRHTPFKQTKDQFRKLVRQSLNKYSSIAPDEVKQMCPVLENVMGGSNEEIIEALGFLLYWSYLHRWHFSLGTEAKNDMGLNGYSNHSAVEETEVITEGFLPSVGVPYIRHEIFNDYGVQHVVYFFYDGTNFRAYIPLCGNWVDPRFMRSYQPGDAGVIEGVDQLAILGECEKDFETCFGVEHENSALDPNSLEAQPVEVLVNLLQAIEDFDSIHEMAALRKIIEQLIETKNG